MPHGHLCRTSLLEVAWQVSCSMSGVGVRVGPGGLTVSNYMCTAMSPMPTYPFCQWLHATGTGPPTSFAVTNFLEVRKLGVRTMRN